MDPSLISILRCPLHRDAGPLVVVAGEGRRREGPCRELRCPCCGSGYPVVQGIPDMLPGQRDKAFRDQEIRQWDEQAARYDEVRQRDPIYMAAVEAAVTGLRPRAGELVLDAACGTGLTIRNYLRPGLRVVALDFSLESLKYLKKLLNHSSVTFVRGDLTALPFAAGVFDKVLCANALQHLPREALRRASVGELARVASPAARVVVTTHNFSAPKRRAGWRKEGPARGPSGDVQYIYRSEAPEFHSVLASALQVDRVHGAGLPLPYRFKLSWLSRRLERWLRRLGASADWGNMLVGICHKTAR